MFRVRALSELDDGRPFGTEVDGVPVVLVRQGDTVHALRDECSHACVTLSDAELTADGLECWLHGSCFDLRTGRPHTPPATEPVDVFAVEIRDGDVFVGTTPVNTVGTTPVNTVGTTPVGAVGTTPVNQPQN